MSAETRENVQMLIFVQRSKLSSLILILETPRVTKSNTEKERSLLDNTEKCSFSLF